MRSTPFRQIFDKVVRMHGRDPRQKLSSDLRDALVDHINDRVRAIWQAWPWPEWTITEERPFREVWGAPYQYGRVNPVKEVSDEVFYLGTGYVQGNDFGTGYGYYRIKSTAPTDPPIGTLPTNTTYWEPMTSVDSFIAYDQTGQRAIGTVLEVHAGNPRTTVTSTHKFAPSEKGVDVASFGSTTVFATFKMPCPEYTMLPFVDGRVYDKGSTVFHPGTGLCYQAVRTTTTVPSDLTTVDNWFVIPFLKIWEGYVTLGAFADSLMEFDQGGNDDLQAKMVLAQYWNQQADDALQAEVDTLVAQGQTLHWKSFCRHRRGFGESVQSQEGLVTLIN